MNILTTRDRRALSVGAGIALGGLCVLRGVPAALKGVRGLRDRVSEQQATVNQVRDLVVGAHAVRDSLDEVLQRIIALAPDLVEGDNTADAEASLSALVSLSASRHDMKVLRLDLLPDSSAGVFGRAAAHAELEGDLTGVVGVIGGLESGAPLLSITSLSIESPDPVPHPRTSEVLRLAFDVRGFYLSRGDR